MLNHVGRKAERGELEYILLCNQRGLCHITNCHLGRGENEGSGNCWDKMEEKGRIEAEKK